MTLNGTYKLTITPDHVRLSTFYYRAERGSILHTALMNRETASLIVSSLLTGAAFVFYTRSLSPETYHLLLFGLLFGLLFFFLRMSIFKERPLDVTFSRDKVSIRYPSFILRRVEIFEPSEVKSISVKKRLFTVENPEGAELIKRISLQHGTVLPDLTEPITLYLLQIELKDGRTRVIYADRDIERLKGLVKEMKRFIDFLKEKINAEAD